MNEIPAVLYLSCPLYQLSSIPAVLYLSPMASSTRFVTSQLCPLLAIQRDSLALRRAVPAIGCPQPSQPSSRAAPQPRSPGKQPRTSA